MEDATLYRSIYQYNDALAPEGEPDGLSYLQLTDQYFKTELSKESMAGSTASSSAALASSTATSSDPVGDRYDSSSTLSSSSSSNVKHGAANGASGPKTSGNSSTPYVNTDINDDLYLQTAEIAYKTLEQLNKKDLGSAPTTDDYGDVYISTAALDTSYGHSSAKKGRTPRKTSTATNDGYGNYVVSDDGSSYETSAPNGHGYDDGYERGSGESDAYGKQGAYGDTSGYSSETGSIYGPVDGYGTSSGPTQGEGHGFRGLNQTQKRLMHFGAVRQVSREIPLYVESQKTDFFQSFSWNERWQALLERPTMTPEEVRQRGEDIAELTEEFLHVARPIVAKIVEELHLPDEQKTFKPVDVGGVAGGEKFMAKQLFLKYARDNIKLRLYNGDAWAQKAAIHELKSLNALIACNIPNLHFPLMACLSCYGHYIVVVSKLPLSKNTLVYGSANVAQTIQTDREVGQLFKQAAEKLNLEPHLVIEGTTKLEKTMYGPVDIEGHKGMDGRSYIVDTARLFPPAPPVRGIRGCHLYKLLRKELVRTNPVPLSSDAFSFFGKVNSDHHNMEVKHAVNRIFAELIPGLLERNDINELLTGGNITDTIHSLGINVRFLGCILASALKLPHITDASITCIMLEMVARASKAVFFHSMRTETDETKSKRDECRRLAAIHWNYLLFSQANYVPVVVQYDPLVPVLSKEEVQTWWNLELIPTLKQRFIFFSGDPEWVVPTTDQLEQSANAVLSDGLIERVRKSPLDLFNRSRQLCGVVFKEAILDQIDKQGNLFFFNNKRLLETDDVSEILVLDKRVQFVPFADIKGAGRFEDAEKFYLAEIQNRSKALGKWHPQVALSFRHLGELYADQRGFEEKARLAYSTAADIIRAYHKTPTTQRLRDLCDILNMHADLYIKYDRVSGAETILLELLELFKPTQDSSDAVNTTSTTPNGTTQQQPQQTTHFTASSQQQTIKEALSSMPKISFISDITDSDQLTEISQALDKLARVVSKMNRFQEAERLYLVARHLKEKVFGPDHWQVGRTLNGHAQLLFAQNRLPEAKEMCGRVKAITENSRGLFHSEVGIALDNLARVVSAEHNYDAADAMLQKALEIKIKSLGENHSFVAMTWDHMATNRFQRLLYATNNQGGGQSPKPLPAEDLQDIATLYNRALATIEASLGASHSAFAITKSNLAVTTAYLKDWPRAVELGEHALSILSSSLGESHPSVAVAKSNLAFMKSSLVTHPPVIPHDALKTVYHAQYISSSAPERSRIPDKIRQLLEKKGLAVTESNAQKVVDMLKRKKQAQQAQGYGTVGYGTTAAKSTAPVTPIMPISLVSPISPSADDYITEPYGGVPLNTGAPEDGYENAPTASIITQDTEYKESDESESDGEEEDDDEIQRAEASKEDDIQELNRKAELDKLQSDLDLLVEQQSSMLDQIEQNTASQQYARPVKASASSRGGFIDALLQCFGRKEKSSSRAYDAAAPSASYGSSYVGPGGAMRSLDAAPVPNQLRSEDPDISSLAQSIKDKSEDDKKRKKKSKMDHGKKVEKFASEDKDDDEDWSSSSSAVIPRATPSSGYENVDEEVNENMRESKMSPRKSSKNLQRDKDKMSVDGVTQPFALSSSSTSLTASLSKESNQALEGRTPSRSSSVSRGAGAARTFSGSTTGTSSSAMPSPSRKRSRGDAAQFGESLDARSPSFGFAPAQSQQQATVATPTEPASGAEEKQHKVPMPSPVSAPTPSVMPPPPVVMALPPPTMPAPTPAAMPPPPPMAGSAPPPPITSPAAYVAPPTVAAKTPPSAYDKYSGYGAKLGDSSSDIPEPSSLLYLGGAPSQPPTAYAAPVTSLHDAFGPPAPMTQSAYFAPSDAGPSPYQISPSSASFALPSAPSSSGPTIGGGGFPVPQQAQPAQAPRNIPAILPPGSMMQSNVYQHRADDRLRQGQAAAPAPAAAKLGKPASVVPHPPPAKQAPGSTKSPLVMPRAKPALAKEEVVKKEVEKGKKDSKNKAPEAPVVISKRKSPAPTNKQSLAVEDERSSPPMGSGMLKKMTKSSKSSVSPASSSAAPSMPSPSSSASPRTQEVQSREEEVRSSSSSSLEYLEMPAIESKVVGLGDELSSLSALQPTETNIQEESRHRVVKPRRAIVAAKPIATSVAEEREVGKETMEVPANRAPSSAIDLSGAMSGFRRSNSRLHEDSQAGEDWDDPLAQLAAATAAASASTGASSAVPERDSGGMAQWMDMDDDLENDMAADDILNHVQDEDLEGLELDEDDRGTPAPHTGSSWGWGGI